MPSIEEVLRRHNIVGVTGDDVAVLLDAALSTAPRHVPSPLTEKEIRFLADYGSTAIGEAAAIGPNKNERLSTAVAQVAHLLTATISPEQAATELGADPVQIEQRIDSGGLWCVDVAGHRRLPRWQFLEGGALLPGLSELVDAIPDGTPLDVVEVRVTSRFDELGGRSIIDFLCTGGDAKVAAQFLDELGRW